MSLTNFENILKKSQVEVIFLVSCIQNTKRFLLVLFILIFQKINIFNMSFKCLKKIEFNNYNKILTYRIKTICKKKYS